MIVKLKLLKTLSNKLRILKLFKYKQFTKKKNSV